MLNRCGMGKHSHLVPYFKQEMEERNKGAMVLIKNEHQMVGLTNNSVFTSNLSRVNNSFLPLDNVSLRFLINVLC